MAKKLKKQNIWGHPGPLFPLFFTEMWERFSFYGIQPLLALFMIASIETGGLGFSTRTTGALVGIFVGSIYLSAIPGGWLADHWLGQQRSVWYGSLLMALGHLSIASSYFLGKNAFFLGLVFIVLGGGLFKTCITVMVGLLYKENDKRRDAGFSIFYMGINLGGFIAPLLTGLTSNKLYWHLSFAIGGFGMLVALIIFRFFAIGNLEHYAKENGLEITWDKPIQRRNFIGRWVLGLGICFAVLIISVMTGVIELDPVYLASLLIELIGIICVGYFLYLFFTLDLNVQERYNFLLCFILLVASAIFWSAFEQQPTSYNLFSNLYVNREYWGYEIPNTWIQSINPLAIIIFAPLFGWLWMALDCQKFHLNYLIKFAMGLFLAAVGFTIMIFAARHVIQLGGQKISILWLVISLLFLTFGELCLSPAGLAAMTQLSPTTVRGQMIGLWYGFSAIGSTLAGLIGGNVSADNLQNLPKVFTISTVSSLIGSLLIILSCIPFYCYKRYTR